MSKENSAGAIIFRENGKRKYLLLLYQGKNFKYWGFVRGRIEKDENYKDTIQREVKEETGINNLKVISNFSEEVVFYYKRDTDIIYKDIKYILGRTETEVIKISEEHLDYCWVDYSEALEKLKFRNDKEMIKKAEEFLNKRI